MEHRIDTYEAAAGGGEDKMLQTENIGKQLKTSENI